MSKATGVESGTSSYQGHSNGLDTYVENNSGRFVHDLFKELWWVSIEYKGPDAAGTEGFVKVEGNSQVCDVCYHTIA
jgi:hypothetical protein